MSILYSHRDTTYVVRKQRKTSYILQKYYLVVTYCNEAKGEWQMFISPSVKHWYVKPSTPKYWQK